MTPTPGSPTSRLLMEYEMHLRNTLAKGMDAESYSLHTFEALLSQSMENLGEFIVSLLASCFLVKFSFSFSLGFCFWFIHSVCRIRRNLVIFHSLFVLVGVVAIFATLLLLLLSSLCLFSLTLYRFIQPSLIEFLISLNSPRVGSCPRQCLNQCPSRVKVKQGEGEKGGSRWGVQCVII